MTIEIILAVGYILIGLVSSVICAGLMRLQPNKPEDVFTSLIACVAWPVMMALVIGYLLFNGLIILVRSWWS